MSEWKEKRLEELVDINPETLSVKKYKGKIEYIDIASVSMGNLSNYTTYDITVAPSRARRIIKDNDIIFSTVRPNLKSYYFVKCPPKNAICSTGFAVLRVKNGVNSRFIYSLVTENSFIDYLSSVAKGSAYPAVDTKDFKKAKVCIPNLQTQNRIADILSAYDDLIENNNKRIKLLEKMAENLYKEWFVRFRFPGYENAEFENGIPKGWEIVKLGDYVEIKGGKRLPEGKSLCAKKTEHPYIRIRDIAFTKFVSLNNCFEYIDNETFETLNRFTVNTNDILISIVGTIGSIACVGKSLNGANLTENCVKLVNIDYFTNDFLYHFLNSDAGKGAIQAGVVGATQPKLPIYNIKKIKLLKPKINLINLFTNIIEPINHEIMMLMDSNQYIIKQRDLLLPRLMSGKLEVK